MGGAAVPQVYATLNGDKVDRCFRLTVPFYQSEGD